LGDEIVSARVGREDSLGSAILVDTPGRYGPQSAKCQLRATGSTVEPGPAIGVSGASAGETCSRTGCPTLVDPGPALRPRPCEALRSRPSCRPDAKSSCRTRPGHCHPQGLIDQSDTSRHRGIDLRFETDRVHLEPRNGWKDAIKHVERGAERRFRSVCKRRIRGPKPCLHVTLPSKLGLRLWGRSKLSPRDLSENSQCRRASICAVREHLPSVVAKLLAGVRTALPLPPAPVDLRQMSPGSEFLGPAEPLSRSSRSSIRRLARPSLRRR